jgi:hypothetical protein
MSRRRQRERSSKRSSPQSRREPRTIKSWARVVEMGESRTPRIAFACVRERAPPTDFSGFWLLNRSPLFALIRRRRGRNWGQRKAAAVSPLLSERTRGARGRNPPRPTLRRRPPPRA